MNTRSIDFLRPVAWQPIGWALFIAGSMCLAFALLKAKAWRQEREAVEMLARQEEAQAKTLRDQRAQRLAVKTDPRESQARLDLGRPWLGVMGAIEAVTNEPVYLLSMTMERSSGLVKLEAEVPSFDDALAYVDGLAATKRLKAPTLRSHQQGLDTQGRPLVRISIEAEWGER